MSKRAKKNVKKNDKKDMACICPIIIHGKEFMCGHCYACLQKYKPYLSVHSKIFSEGKKNGKN